MNSSSEGGDIVVLKSNNIINVLKLIILIVFVFYIAKVRFEIGGSLLVDLVFFLTCTALAFLFFISSEAQITYNGKQAKVKLMKNLLGVKLVSISNQYGRVLRKITTSSSLRIEQVFENRVVVISNMDQSKVEVCII